MNQNQEHMEPLETVFWVLLIAIPIIDIMIILITLIRRVYLSVWVYVPAGVLTFVLIAILSGSGYIPHRDWIILSYLFLTLVLLFIGARATYKKRPWKKIFKKKKI